MNASGFYIEQLVVKGSGKPDAVLDFIDGLNVVAGASDTGKSYAWSCLDYAFGASTAPRAIAAARGYEAIVVRLVARATGQLYEIERTLAGGEVLMRLLDSGGTASEIKTIPAKHDGGNPDTLSGHLLRWSGLWGRQLRKNARGDRRSLSFRDVAFLSLVDEERIIAERPPHLSGLPQEKTLEGDALRLLATGEESGRVIALPSPKEIAGQKAKSEFLDQMITAAVAEFQKFGIAEDALDAELGAIDAARGAALSDYDLSRQGTVRLEAELAEHGRGLREVQARTGIVAGLRQRFDLLDEHYESDLKRLQTIEETGVLLESLPAKACPFCGAPPSEHRERECTVVYRIADVQLAAQKEQEKINVLRSDLKRVRAELKEEADELERRRIWTAGEMESSKARIDQELMPRIRQSAEALRAQTDKRDLVLRARAAAAQLVQLRGYAVEFLQKQPEPTTASVTNTLTTGDLDQFAMTVEILLREWNYPDVGRVVFSEAQRDLVIAGQLRTSHGKGVRALTCAAFILGLLRHCRTRDLPHPSFVVLDSPLVAYEEADDDPESVRIRQAGVKEAFYTTLAGGGANGQVIIFENDDPPANLDGAIKWHHFTKSAMGRYGFFPRAT